MSYERADFFILFSNQIAWQINATIHGDFDATNPAAERRRIEKLITTDKEVASYHAQLVTLDNIAPLVRIARTGAIAQAALAAEVREAMRACHPTYTTKAAERRICRLLKAAEYFGLVETWIATDTRNKRKWARKTARLDIALFGLGSSGSKEAQQ
ncbi:MAG: hypothetical protein KGS44_16210 [Alphaproteobacteria bacterium]|nr:hypothetical protein [Alphaproteobacteria bacterium]